MVARIWDQAANYIETPITPFRADALVAADGAELTQEVSMPAVFDAGQAWHIAGIMLRDARDPMTVTLPFKMSAYTLELFDGVLLDMPFLGWGPKEFRVMARAFMPDGFVQLTLKETTAQIFVPGLAFLPQGYAPNSGLPKPWDIHPPIVTGVFSDEDELIVANDGTVFDSVRVTWAPIQDASILSGGNVEVQWLQLGESVWQSVIVPGNSTEARFTGVDDSEYIVIRTRTKNSLAVSDWSAQILYQVIGKTAPPPDIENLNIAGSVLSWNLPRRVPDLAGFVFRFQYGNNLDWNSAAPLHNGLITASPYDLVTRPSGVVTIMGKAQDTSGNQSLATANIVMNLGDAPVANVVEQWDFGAMAWPYQAGEQVGWALVGGKPSANAMDSLYGTDDQSFYGADLVSFYDLSAYGQMVYVTQEIPIVKALAGSIMTLAVAADGTDLHIDYRLSGPGSLYGADNDPFYGLDADSFYDAPGAWQPWPGQLVSKNDVYQFRVTIGAGQVRGVLNGMVLTVDAPDIVEQIADLAVAAGGTLIVYRKNFTVIKTIGATLQANGSGGETVETTKTPNLAPVVRVFNASHTSVGGATVDIQLQGY